MNLIGKNDMIDGNVADFIDNLTIQDEMVRYEGNLYYFYGIRFDEERRLYYTSVDKFRNNINEFEREIYRYESADMSDCLEHLLEDKYWDGKCFYEVEKLMKWVDG